MIFLFFTIILIVADQATKICTINFLKPIGTVEFIKNIISFTYVENRGAAFGILQNSRWIFIVFTVVVIAAMVIYTIKIKPKSTLYMLSASLIVAGGVGNLIDRIFRGYVVDMIEVTFVNYPVFNFADICVVIGAILLCIFVICDKDLKKQNGEN